MVTQDRTITRAKLLELFDLSEADMAALAVLTCRHEVCVSWDCDCSCHEDQL